MEQPSDASPAGVQGIRAADAAPPNPGLHPKSRPYSGLRNRITTAFRWLGFDPPDRWLVLLGAFVLCDILILCWIQVMAYYSYYTFSQDFGSFNQSFFTTVHNHLLLYYTANIPAGSNGTFMSIHFMPLAFLVLPFYAIAPGPATLLVIKVVALAAGAFPAFGIAHRRLGSPRWGAFLGTIYLLSPITMTLGWIDFDMEVFLPFMILCAIYFLIQRRYIAFLTFWILSLATIETVIPFLLLFILVALLGSFLGPKLLSQSARNRERFALVVALGLAIGWFLLAFLTLRYFSAVGGPFGSGYASHYQVLGAQSFEQVIPQALLHPNLAGAALSYQGSNKLAYVVLLFGCLAFLSFLGELRYLVPVFGWIALALLSNTAAMYSFGSQYLGYVSPFVFAGAIGGIAWARIQISGRAVVSTTQPPDGRSTARLRHWRLPRADETLVPGVLVVALVVAVAIGNPLLPHPAASLSSIQYGLPSPDAHTKLLDRIISLIPPTASVLTTSHLFAQVSDRPNAYVLPTAQSYAGTNSYVGALDQFINDSNYVLLDFTLDGYNSQVMQGLGNYSGFGIEAASDGVFLLLRGWTGPPLPGFTTPNTVTYPASSLAFTSNKNLILHQSNGSFEYNASKASKSVTLWIGPSVNRVVPGEYNLTVTYRLDPSTTGPLVRLRATETPLTVTPVQYLNTSTGHHYTYSFQRSVNQTLVGPVNLTASQGLHQMESGAVSITLDVSQLMNLGYSGLTVAGTAFWILVTGFSLTWVGPPPSFDDPA